MKKLLIPALVLAALTASANDTCPMHAKHTAAASNADGSTEHGHKVDSRHDTFGMSHSTTRHDFRLYKDGGAIELRANDAEDANTIATIRKHLGEITTAFKAGDYSAPMFVHGKKPAGIDDMARSKNELTWRYEALPTGGRIRVTTANDAALAAIHDFMKFQVIEHRTGNSGKIEDEQR